MFWCVLDVPIFTRWRLASTPSSLPAPATRRLFTSSDLMHRLHQRKSAYQSSIGLPAAVLFGAKAVVHTHLACLMELVTNHHWLPI